MTIAAGAQNEALPLGMVAGSVAAEPVRGRAHPVSTEDRWVTPDERSASI
jgi:hypothetical protein